jgi:hypothetical protein
MSEDRAGLSGLSGLFRWYLLLMICPDSGEKRSGRRQHRWIRQVQRENYPPEGGTPTPEAVFQNSPGIPSSEMMAVTANLASHGPEKVKGHPVLCFLNDSERIQG